MTRASNQRAATIERQTRETTISVELDLGGGEVAPDDRDRVLRPHARAARPSRPTSALVVRASGDLETGGHHTVEDVGIALGQALDRALGDRAGIRRYGHAVVPMDEALAECAIDVSGRPFCRFDSELPPVTIAGFEAELTEEFFRAVAANAKLTVHLGTRYGSNTHHLIEACFKAFARALREAVAIDPGAGRRAEHQGDAELTRIAILDYGMGNLRSVEKAFERVGAKAVITSEAEIGARGRRTGAARRRRVREGDGADRASSSSTG